VGEQVDKQVALLLDSLAGPVEAVPPMALALPLLGQVQVGKVMLVEAAVGLQVRLMV
jgi:hypothetical protein